MADDGSSRLATRVALVTGASSGIGEATARALADEGARLALVARRADRLEQLARALRAGGTDVLVHAADLSTAAGAQAAVDATVEALGGLDILINNAGVMFLGPIEETDPADWERMIDINLLGLMVACRAAIGPMRDRGGGHIVNVSSVSGRFAGPTQGGYNATKWGVNGFSEALRREVHGLGIRVTLIEPGVVDTELTHHIPHAATRERYEANIAKMEMLQSEDVADAIRYVVTRPRRVSINEVLIRPLDQG